MSTFASCARYLRRALARPKSLAFAIYFTDTRCQRTHDATSTYTEVDRSDFPKVPIKSRLYICWSIKKRSDLIVRDNRTVDEQSGKLPEESWNARWRHATWHTTCALARLRIRCPFFSNRPFSTTRDSESVRVCSRNRGGSGAVTRCHLASRGVGKPRKHMGVSCRRVRFYL